MHLIPPLYPPPQTLSGPSQKLSLLPWSAAKQSFSPSLAASRGTLENPSALHLAHCDVFLVPEETQEGNVFIKNVNGFFEKNPKPL